MSVTFKVQQQRTANIKIFSGILILSYFPPLFRLTKHSPTLGKASAVTHVLIFQTACKMMSRRFVIAWPVSAKKTILYYCNISALLQIYHFGTPVSALETSLPLRFYLKGCVRNQLKLREKVFDTVVFAEILFQRFRE